MHQLLEPAACAFVFLRTWAKKKKMGMTLKPSTLAPGADALLNAIFFPISFLPATRSMFSAKSAPLRGRRLAFPAAFAIAVLAVCVPVAARTQVTCTASAPITCTGTATSTFTLTPAQNPIPSTAAPTSRLRPAMRSMATPPPRGTSPMTARSLAALAASILVRLEAASRMPARSQDRARRASLSITAAASSIRRAERSAVVASQPYWSMGLPGQ